MRSIALLENVPHEPESSTCDDKVSEELGRVTKGDVRGRMAHLKQEHGDDEDRIHFVCRQCAAETLAMNRRWHGVWNMVEGVTLQARNP